VVVVVVGGSVVVVDVVGATVVAMVVGGPDVAGMVVAGALVLAGSVDVVDETDGSTSNWSSPSSSPARTRMAMITITSAASPATKAATGPRSRYHGCSSSSS
jgi:hypothetical protein